MTEPTSLSRIVLWIGVSALIRLSRHAMASSTPAPRRPLPVKKRRLSILPRPLVPLFIAGSAPCGRAPDTRLGRALDWARKRERRVRRVSGRLYTLQPEADAHYL